MKSLRAPLATGLLILALSVVPASAQTNDSFANRLTLTGPDAVAVSNNLRATREGGEPNHASGGGKHSLWWTWTAPANGLVNFSAYGGGALPPGFLATMLPRALAVYTGNSLTALSEVASANTPGASIFYGPSVNTPPGPSFNIQVTAGTAYQIAVDTPTGEGAGTADDGTVILSINQEPAIYSAAGASGTAGGSFTYSILASNTPTAFTATNLPPGLSVNPYTGDITGVTPAVGTYIIGLAATNPGGIATATLTLTSVAPAPGPPPTVPVIQSGAMTGGTVGAAFSYYLSASNSPSGYGATGLPDGLSLNQTSGLISGTPTAAGDFTVAVSATNQVGTGGASVVFHLVAGPHPPVITSSLAASGTVGSSFYYSVYTSYSSSVDEPTSYGASNLPPGLGFDTVYGYLRGTPTAAGVYTVPLTATNAGGTSRAVVTVTIGAPTPAAGPQPALPQLFSSATAIGTAGTAFIYQLAAGNAPTSFAATGLPPGLSLNTQNGYVTGTPSATGLYLVPVSASNAYGTSSATLTVTVTASATPTAAASLPPIVTSAAEVSSSIGGYVYYPILLSNASYYYSYYGSSTTVSVAACRQG